jgi:hypothetical protein
MIQAKKYLISGFYFKEYWFVEKIFKPDILKIATYRNYLGSSHRWMFKHISYTLENDLSRSEEEILKSFKPNTRNEIRKTEKLNHIFGINKITMEEYIEFFNSFAKVKRLPLENKKRLNSYDKENIIFTSAHDLLTFELLVVHVYLADGERARLLHSASQIHNMEDDKKRKKVGYFNRRLHWEDMLYFKNLGYSVYDWGGYSHKYDDKVSIGINNFKKSFGGVEREVINYNSCLYDFILFLAKIARKL